MLSTMPTLDWEDVPAAIGYTIVISRNNTFTLPILSVSPTGTASSYTPTAPLPGGIPLYWRVQSRGTNGPSDWSATRSFTSANPPSIPALVLPPAGGLVTDYTPALSWSALTIPAGTTFHHYQVQIASDTNFNSLVVDDSSLTTLSTLQFSPATDLAPNSTFFWRVRAFNTLNQASQWSASRSFRTALLPPTLSAPADADTMLSTMPTLDWDDVPGATGYTIVISKNNTFTLPVLSVSPTGTASSYTPTAALPGGIPLYWRVQTRGTNGPSNWSATRSFTSANPPSIPSQVLPLAGGMVTDFTPTFSWSIVTLPASTTFDHYQLQVATNSAFTAPAINESVSTLSSPTFTPTAELTPNTTYYWRVASYNTLGQYSQWSAVRTFQTSIIPPLLLTPTPDKFLTTLKPVFDWQDVPGATGYIIEVATNSEFTTKVWSVTLTTATSTYTPTANLPGKKILFWRVQTRGPSGLSGWSEVRAFMTP